MFGRPTIVRLTAYRPGEEQPCFVAELASTTEEPSAETCRLWCEVPRADDSFGVLTVIKLKKVAKQMYGTKLRLHARVLVTPEEEVRVNGLTTDFHT